MSDNNMPVQPAPTGNQHLDARARQEHFAALTSWFTRGGNGASDSSDFSDEPGSGAAFMAKVRAAEAQQRAENPVQEFDREMREQGVQRNDTLTGEVDQRALQYLDNLARTTPPAQRTREWLTTWTRDRESVLLGRRYGETHEQFSARRAGSLAAPDSAKPTPAEPVADVVGVGSDHFTTQEHGYQLPPCPEGFEIDRDAATAMLATARAAGVPQAAVTAYFRELARQTAGNADAA